MKRGVKDPRLIDSNWNGEGYQEPRIVEEHFDGDIIYLGEVENSAKRTLMGEYSHLLRLDRLKVKGLIEDGQSPERARNIESKEEALAYFSKANSPEVVFGMLAEDIDVRDNILETWPEISQDYSDQVERTLEEYLPSDREIKKALYNSVYNSEAQRKTDEIWFNQLTEGIEKNHDHVLTIAGGFHFASGTFTEHNTLYDRLDESEFDVHMIDGRNHIPEDSSY